MEAGLLLLRGARDLSPLLAAKGSRRLGGGKWGVLRGLLALGGVPGGSDNVGSGGYVRAADSIWVGIAGGGLRAGGAGTVLTGDGATTGEDLGSGGGALSGVATFGLVGDVTGFRMGTAGIGREAGLAGDCVRGRGGAAGGLSLRIGGGARRGGRGAELPISFLRGGTGRPGTGAGGVGTLRTGGVGARGPSDFGMDGGLPSAPLREELQN